MEIFMLISFSVVAIVALVTFSSIIRGTFTLEREDRNRIIDLFAIGFIIYIVGINFFSNYLIPQPLALSGLLIFLYGFIILLYKTFIEGYRESYDEEE